MLFVTINEVFWIIKYTFQKNIFAMMNCMIKQSSELLKEDCCFYRWLESERSAPADFERKPTIDATYDINLEFYPDFALN